MKWFTNCSPNSKIKFQNNVQTLKISGRRFLQCEQVSGAVRSLMILIEPFWTMLVLSAYVGCAKQASAKRARAFSAVPQSAETAAACCGHRQNMAEHWTAIDAQSRSFKVVEGKRMPSSFGLHPPHVHSFFSLLKYVKTIQNQKFRCSF